MQSLQEVQQILDDNGANSTSINPSGIIDSLVPILFTAVIGSLLIVLTFAIIWIVIKVKNHKATKAMQQDIKAIREMLEKSNTPDKDTIILAAAEESQPQEQQSA